MRIESRNGQDEAHILAGVLTDATVAARVAAKWDAKDGGPFASRWANLVAFWAVKYHRRYGTAPGAAIQGMFEQWAGTAAADKDTVALVERFLSGLSDSYAAAETTTAEYIIDMAGRHFARVAAQRAVTASQALLDAGDVGGGWGALKGAVKPEMGAGAGCDILLDKEQTFATHTEDQKPLIVYPGALGRFFDNAFSRDNLVGLTAATGRGKTWWMMDLALTAAKQRNRTALIVVGDMSLAQIDYRIQQKLAGLPRNARPFNYPTALSRAKGEFFADVTLERRQAEPLTGQAGWEAKQRTQMKDIKSKESYFKVSQHASMAVTAEQIGAVVDGWAGNGWTPDVIVVDYPDNLAPPAGIRDTRDQINVTWKQLKGISQTYHACLIVATQSDADGYDRVTLRKKNFSEARFKNDHVSAMMNLNQTDDEKRKGLYRLNWSKFREAEYDEARCVHVASCLAVGNPAVLSCL